MQNAVLEGADASARLGQATRMGPISLAVNDLAGMTAWYAAALGLVMQARDTGTVVLGADGGGPILRLIDRAEGRPADPRVSGLFHLAVLLPSREDLARWAAHAYADGITLDGASDHLVSEALYLSDPEGNGIEVYRDRPRAGWRRANGELMMGTEALDMRRLVGEGRADPNGWRGAPTGTTVGHVHLKVHDIRAARRFHVDTLGLDVMAAMPTALFISAGGYHHHLGMNTWQSAGRPRGGRTSLGLVDTVVELSGSAEVAAVAGRLESAGHPVERIGEGFAAAVDPSGNRIVLAERAVDAATMRDLPVG